MVLSIFKKTLSMKHFLLFLLIIFTGCNSDKKSISSKSIIEKSIKKHDPKSNWNSTTINVHIQEPRLRNTNRFSVVKLNNKNGVFVLNRNRENSISTHIIDENNLAKTLLNNKIETDSVLIKKYRLDAKRNFGYKRFYQILLGLPMSLKNEDYKIKKEAIKTVFNNKKSYKIELKLKESLFSKHWNLYFSTVDFSIIGIEMIFPDKPEKGESIIFDKIIKINDMLIPRIRHWHELDNSYSGSDIIVKKIN